MTKRSRQRPALYQVQSHQLSDEQVARLPRDAQSGQPLAPMAEPGYYPGYSTLANQNFWDEATRKVVLDRVENPPPIRFFSSEEAARMQAVCDRLLPQDDRDMAHRVPLMNYIDERLYKNQLYGYRYEDMPPDRDAYHLGLQAIEEIAQHLYRRSFIDLDPREQDEVLFSIHQAKPPAAHEIWQRMSVHRFWSFLMNDVVDAYYRHPYAWDEIGFGGPAYPRGYMRLEGGQPEPWEREEQRYEWQAPASTLSDQYIQPGGPGGHAQQPTGQGGTH